MRTQIPFGKLGMIKRLPWQSLSILLVSSAPLLTGCGTFHLASNKAPVEKTDKSDYVQVESVVTSYNDRSHKAELLRKPKLNFVEIQTDDIRERSENQRVISACAKAAALQNFNTTIGSKDCTDCVDVLVSHKFSLSIEKGRSQQSCSTYELAGSLHSYCSTYTPVYSQNNRWIAMTFMNRKTKEKVHAIDVYSTGTTPSVLAVASEMCFAGLTFWPEGFEKRSVSATLGLEFEQKEARPNK